MVRAIKIAVGSKLASQIDKNEKLAAKSDQEQVMDLKVEGS